MPETPKSPYAVRVMRVNLDMPRVTEYGFNTKGEYEAFMSGFGAARRSELEKPTLELYGRKDDGTWHTTVAHVDEYINVSERTRRHG